MLLSWYKKPWSAHLTLMAFNVKQGDHCHHYLQCSEWVNEWCFTSLSTIFGHIETVFACDRYYGFYHIALPHWSTVPQTQRIQIPHPVTLSWYQANHLVPIFICLWFDSTGDRSHDLPLTRTLNEMYNLKLYFVHLYMWTFKQCFVCQKLAN